MAILPFCVVAVAGCGSSPRLEPVDPPATQAGTAPLAESGSAPSSIRAGWVYPIGAAEKQYAVVDLRRDKAAAGIESRVVSEASSDDTWTVTSVRMDTDGTASPPQTSTLRLEDDGSVVALSVLTPRDTDTDGALKLFTYEPPMVMAPAEFGMTEVYEQTVDLVERDPDETDRVVGRGKATRRVRMATPIELQDAFGDAAQSHGVVSEMEVRFGPAIDTRLTVSEIDPRGLAGIIRETLDRELRVSILTLKKDRLRFDPILGEADR